MNYIILDLEWNQAIKKSKLYLEGEIIQIGAVKLNENFEKINTFKIGIAPKYYKKLHWKVAELTQISQTDLTYGFEFPTAFKYFKNWCGDEFTLLTWGNDDLRILKSNLNLHRLDPNWIPVSYDLQRIFDKQIAHENRQCSLLYAMEIIHKKPLAAHDALHDALNTFEISKMLDLNKAFEEYHTYFHKAISSVYPQLAGENSNLKSYKKRNIALKNSFEKELICPCCSCTMEHIEWVKQNHIKFISLAKCSCGHEYFIRMKLKQSESNRYTAPIYIYQLDPHLTAYYIEKRLKKLPKKAAAQYNTLYLPSHIVART